MSPLIDRYSFAFAVAILLGGLLLFYHNTNEFIGSLVAAILSAALAWMAYVLVRLVILALRK